MVKHWVVKLLSYHKSDGFFWFRILGKGLVFKNTNKRELLFSERNKLVKYIKVGKWIIKKC